MREREIQKVLISVELKVSANISTKLRQYSEFHAPYSWASQAVACGSTVEDFSSTSQLLLLYMYTSATTPATCLQPYTLAFSSPFIHWYYMPRSKQQMHADPYSLYFQYLVWVFSPLRQHLLFPCEQLLCNITKSSLCLFNLFCFRGGGCIAYLRLIIINLYSHQKSAQIRKSKHCNVFL